MKTLAALAILLGAITSNAMAQSAAVPIKGAEALRNRVGDPGAWRIVVQKNEASAKMTPSDSGNAAEILSVDRANKILRCTLKAAGEQQIYWFTNEAIFLKRSGSPTYFVIPPFSESRPSVDFSASDFPELRWIASLFSSGTTTVNGNECYVFSDPGGPDGGETESVTRIAYISRDSKLPIRVVSGGRTSDYLYPKPLARIDLPDALKLAKSTCDQWRRQTYPPMTKP